MKLRKRRQDEQAQPGQQTPIDEQTEDVTRDDKCSDTFDDVVIGDGCLGRSVQLDR